MRVCKLLADFRGYVAAVAMLLLANAQQVSAQQQGSWTERRPNARPRLACSRRPAPRKARLSRDKVTTM